MARPRFQSTAEREARQRLIDAAPLIGDHADVSEVSIALTFMDPEGKEQPTPRGVTYTADARAYFRFACPLRDCVDGGFDVTPDLARALTKRADGHTGAMTCHGTRPRPKVKDNPCNLELRYALEIRRKAKAA
jgi:hypothetical protein